MRIHTHIIRLGLNERQLQGVSPAQAPRQKGSLRITELLLLAWGRPCSGLPSASCAGGHPSPSSALFLPASPPPSRPAPPSPVQSCPSFFLRGNFPLAGPSPRVRLRCRRRGELNREGPDAAGAAGPRVYVAGGTRRGRSAGKRDAEGWPGNRTPSSMDAPRRDMELLSNSLAAYAHIRANPESFGLYFVLGVCFGLLLTLCLLVISISCAPRPRPRGPAPCRDPRSSTLEPDDDDEEDEDTMTRLGPDDTLPAPELSVEPDGPLSVNVFTSAEELERAQRLEERERILREIWRTGQPDLLGTGTLGPGPTGTLGRMHYY
ncbi:protein eva-1 homolog B isoform X1 [Cavia porcellus]